jgi:PTS system ascorbate-specific IIA component
MSVGLVMVTHGEIGAAMLDVAVRMLGHCPLRVEILQVGGDADPDVLRQQARQRIEAVDQGEGVLVLTDMYGGTPSNVARSLADGKRVCMIAGLNLPMLIRILNYAQLDAAELAAKAVSGGRDGIFGSKAEDRG